MTFNKEENLPVMIRLHSREHTGAFVTIALVLAFLLVANLYLLNRLIGAQRDTADLGQRTGLQIEDLKTQNQLLLRRYSILRSSQADQAERLQIELDTVAKQLGFATGQGLDRARNMIVELRKQQEHRSSDLQKQLTSKAENDDVSILNENLSSTQYQLESTGRTVDTLAQDLATARTELGGLLATTQEQIQALREKGESDYQEFRLVKGTVQRIGYVNLLLKKTDVQKQRFSLNLVMNDQDVQVKSRNIAEPMFFYVGQLPAPYELVITEVSADNVVGYIRIPNVDIQNFRFVPRT